MRRALSVLAGMGLLVVVLCVVGAGNGVGVWALTPVLTVDTPADTPTVTITNTPDPCAPVWFVVPGPNLSEGGTLNGVEVVSAYDVWAVGYTNSIPLVEHWDGISWSVVSTPPLGGSLQAVAAVSTDDIWTVGSYSNGGRNQTLVEHWNGISWSIVPSPNATGYTHNYLKGVAAVSVDDVWAVGYYSGNGGSSYQTLIEHWDGTSWSVVFSAGVLDSNFLHGVAAISANDVWAVGVSSCCNGSVARTLVEHWDGTSWSVISSPNHAVANANTLKGVAAVSADDVWAVGYYYHNSVTNGELIEHWDGSSWSIVPSPNVTFLSGVAAISADDVWAVGPPMNWNGSLWSVPTSNIVGSLNAVAVTSANDVWAVGANYDGTYYQTVAAHYLSPCAPTITPTIIPTDTPTNTPTSTITSTPTPTPILVGHVTWQGPPPQPHARQQQPITLTLKLGATEVNYPSQNTDASGFFTVSLGSLPAGEYEWRVKGPKYLANSGVVQLAGGQHTQVEMGLMRAGDANNDNRVSIGDTPIVKLTFGFCLGDTGYDARGDFDNSNCVSIVDFNLLKANFGFGGAPPLVGRKE